ncbi:MAG: alpha/beta fold hydrolase [Bacteroidetes bacterium]|jgi:pimeloyl-ACP methyl ester carboxylesterase|nr:alpha/beta fold hydrolase [Bacteroidota bacterium]
MPYRRVNDLRMHYDEQGSGPPLLLVHGLGSSHKDWFAQKEVFKHTHTVIAPDLRGHGATETPPGPYSIPQMARDLAVLLNQLGLQPAHVVGLSMGAMVSLQLAHDVPQAVRTLTVVNCDPEYRLNTLRRWISYLFRMLLVRLCGPEVLGRILAPRLLPDPAHAALRRTFIRRYRQNDTHALVASIRAIAGWSIDEQLDAIRQPALIVASQHDYTDVDRKAMFAQQMPDARLAVLPGVHHAVPVERPALFNHQLQAFLAEVTFRDAGRALMMRSRPASS